MTGIPPIRIVYFGTPPYAVPALRELAANARFKIELVVTQPDRPAGRGHGLRQPDVKIAAQELDLPVYQPESLRTAADREPLEAPNADLFVVAAYGLIFGQKTLAIPRYGCLNLHASLLPKYRGASPVIAAIIAGDAVTGVTLMRMDRGMDTGGIIATTSIPITTGDTTVTLTERLALAGATLALDAIPDWIAGNLTAMPQPETGATVVRPLVKADGWINWNRTAPELDRQIRAMQPWPRAFTTTPTGQTVQILRAQVERAVGLPPGTLVLFNKSVLVACGDGALALERVQPAGSAEMDTISLVQGRQLADGEVLGAENAPAIPSPLIRSVDQ